MTRTEIEIVAKAETLRLLGEAVAKRAAWAAEPGAHAEEAAAGVEYLRALKNYVEETQRFGERKAYYVPLAAGLVCSATCLFIQHACEPLLAEAAEG